MAKFIQLDDAVFLNGAAQLFRGDDWSLPGKIVDVVDGVYSRDVDMTGISATAYFPAATGGAPVSGNVQFLTQEVGKFNIQVPAAYTPQVATGQLGFYILTQVGATGAQATYAMTDALLNVQDRNTVFLPN